MTRGRGVPSKQTIDTQWPHQVRVDRLPHLGLEDRSRLLRECSDDCKAVGGYDGPGLGFYVFGFARPEEAAAFLAKFGGEAWSIEPIMRTNKLGWDTGHIKSYRKVPLTKAE